MVLGGSFGKPWGSWSCSYEASGDRQGILGGILWFLVMSLGSWRVLGGSLGDLVGDLGPHRLCTPLFQRFTLFLVECVLGVSWNVLGAHKHRVTYTIILVYLGVYLLAAMRLQVLPGRLLGQPVGRPRAPYAMHTKVSAYLIVLC